MKRRGTVLSFLLSASANAYAFMGNTELQKKYLAISAIADIQAATKEYISLWKLANLLFREGDIKRAYTYIECSMQDATFCNARYRTQEISELLPVISRTYEKQVEGGENTNGCPGHSDICLADHIADCSDVHFLSDEAAECSPESGEHYE